MKNIFLGFHSSDFGRYYSNRYYGPVRPVRDAD